MIFGKHINRYYLRHLPWLLLGVLSLVMVDVLQLEIPRLYSSVINGINGDPVGKDGKGVFDLDFLLDEVCLPLIFIIVALVIGRFLWRICFFGSALRTETDIRHRMFDHCKDLSHQYYQTNKVGTLMSLFTNDLETVQDCFGMGVMIFFDAILLGTLAFVKMWRMNPTLTLFSMVPMVFLLIAALVVGKYLTVKWDRRQKAFSDLSDFAQESFSGISVIKAFVKEAKELWAFKKLNKENEETNVDYTKLSAVLRICTVLFIESVICVILGYGGYVVYMGDFNAGDLVEFIGYFNAIIWPVMAISELIDMHSRGRASLDRISELLDAPLDVVDKKDVDETVITEGGIEFRGLSFRFPDGDKDVLKNVSFKINPGESVGIVGRTGSGKTAVVDLILRTYNVPDGTLFVDGHDVNSIPIKAVRDACAYVPQDNFLFSDTIAHNIAFGRDDAGETEIEAAASLSDVHNDVRGFSEGYGTVLGERGVTVSGGQKQRISIARALLKNAPILVLDDSLSAVDTATERVILENLRASRRGKTTLLIAHRISTVEGLDKIVLLEDGEVLAVGSHTELCEGCEVYRRMVELQKLEDEGVSADA
ncbi:MAG: ABC transporter ATP-binding protein [Clostridia bacterium]|nr:ABC transporter ATP-binding protein [Clostridia bacterium]